MGYIYIIGTILFTVYGQIILKWRVSLVGDMPLDFFDKILFLLSIAINPWIISSLICAFLAFLCWMAAMTKFDLSYAYPFMSLSFVLVLISSVLLFNEPLSVFKVIGMILIMAGIVVGSQGWNYTWTAEKSTRILSGHAPIADIRHFLLRDIRF